MNLTNNFSIVLKHKLGNSDENVAFFHIAEHIFIKNINKALPEKIIYGMSSKYVTIIVLISNQIYSFDELNYIISICKKKVSQDDVNREIKIINNEIECLNYISSTYKIFHKKINKNILHNDFNKFIKSNYVWDDILFTTYTEGIRKFNEIYKQNSNKIANSLNNKSIQFYISEKRNLLINNYLEDSNRISYNKKYTYTKGFYLLTIYFNIDNKINDYVEKITNISNILDAPNGFFSKKLRNNYPYMYLLWPEVIYDDIFKDYAFSIFFYSTSEEIDYLSNKTIEEVKKIFLKLYNIKILNSQICAYIYL